MERFICEIKRTHYCGDLRLSDVDKNVVLFGWVSGVRDFGSCIFVVLRDRSGIVQLKFDKSDDENLFKKAWELKPEYVIGVSGSVADRKEDRNPKMATGDIEIIVRRIEVFNTAKTPPFVIQDEVDAGENLRLTYRYLDLRRPVLMKNILLRSRINKIVHRYFDSKGFIEVETPILLKSTPEGARDYLVPSRMYRGKFYALPQSPQMLKQLLMVSGLDRYYQICRCFRDEDLRIDRQPEFTQIDVEMSFIGEEDIFSIIEGFISYLLLEVHGKKINTPFRRITYEEAMGKYGSDKPDLRFGLELTDFSEILSKSDFRVFRETVASGGIIKGICLNQGGSFSRSRIDAMEQIVRGSGAKGLIWMKSAGSELSGSISKFLKEDEKKQIVQKSGMADGDMILIVAGEPQIVHESMGVLRLHLGDELGLRNRDELNFLWVTDFPLFEISKEDGRTGSMHHPFTSPAPEDIAFLEEKPMDVRARAYDLVLNGVELGGGSIRIHDQSLQKRIFRILGLNEQQAEEKFGFLMKAFEFGAPPHGGIALGMDRIIMILAGADSLRDVIAFPKTRRAQCLMTGSPSEVTNEQLDELGISCPVPDNTIVE